jgi:hypothetical protein
MKGGYGYLDQSIAHSNPKRKRGNACGFLAYASGYQHSTLSIRAIDDCGHCGIGFQPVMSVHPNPRNIPEPRI